MKSATHYLGRWATNTSRLLYWAAKKYELTLSDVLTCRDAAKAILDEFKALDIDCSWALDDLERIDVDPIQAHSMIVRSAALFGHIGPLLEKGLLEEARRDSRDFVNAHFMSAA